MITESYRDVTITLLEDENKWQFTVNGRQRTAPTLPKAREYIDNALDAVKEKKEKPWEPFYVWTNNGYGGHWRKVKVTSIAEREYGRNYLWTVDENATDRFGDKKPERKKISEVFLRIDSPDNDAAVAEIRRLKSECDRIGDQINEIEGGMARFVLPQESVTA